MSKAGSGGGQSGIVDYPNYIKAFHRALLDGSTAYGAATIDYNEGFGVIGHVVGDLDEQDGLATNSPYDGANAFDPGAAFSPTDGSPLDLMRDDVSTLRSLAAAITPEDDWDSLRDKAFYDADTYFPSVDTSLAAISTARSSAVRAFVQAAAGEVQTLVDNAIDAAISKATLSDDTLADMVDEYEEAAIPALMRSVNRFAGGMAEINAVVSSAFPIGIALIERSFQSDVRKFRSELQKTNFNTLVATYLQSYTNLVGFDVDAFMKAFGVHIEAYTRARLSKEAYMPQAINQMLSLTQLQAQTTANVSGLTNDVQRMTIAAKVEQTTRNLDLDVKDAMWFVEAYQAAANFLASISGATVTRSDPGASSGGGWAGAASGALSGAYIGSQIPGIAPYGALIGAVVGGISGGLS